MQIFILLLLKVARIHVDIIAYYKSFAHIHVLCNVFEATSYMDLHVEHGL